MKVLLVEDDADMSKALTRALEARGFEITPCFDGVNALRLIKENVAEVVLLDLSIPIVDGLHVLQRARAQGITTPVLILTARGAVGDRVAGLNAGADDYLSKPFDLEELEARIRALMRRARGTDDTVLCGELRFERNSGTFYRLDEPLELAPREYAVLKALATTPDHAVTKERLFRQAFPDEDTIQIEAIEVVVYRLRKKLTGAGVEIMTLRGLGYLLRARPGKDQA